MREARCTMHESKANKVRRTINLSKFNSYFDAQNRIHKSDIEPRASKKFVLRFAESKSQFGLRASSKVPRNSAYFVKKRFLKKHDIIGLYSLYWAKEEYTKCNPKK